MEVIKIPQEFMIVDEEWNRKVHGDLGNFKLMFQNKVNEYLKNGWRVLNCQHNRDPQSKWLYSAFLVKDL